MTRRLLIVIVLMAAGVSAQPTPRRATNLAALVAHATFYGQRPIVVVGTVKLLDTGQLRVEADGTSMTLVSKGPAPDGLDEIRGEFLDLGRLGADSPQLAGYDLKKTFNVDPEGAWPRPGQVLAIVASSVEPATPPSAPSIRNAALFPSRYAEQRITLTGQFGARNLLGDLPDAPAQSRYDFVLRSADAAIWVTNIRPRGKDFELALDSRIDTGRWVEVSGTLQQGRGLQWLDATTGTLKLTQAPTERPDNAPITIEPAPPPEVIFSTPIPDETDVPLSSSVRIQFSRDIDPPTFKTRIAVRYSGANVTSQAPASPVEFSTQYLPGMRVLELKFTDPLVRFSTVTVDLLDGILGTDKQPLKPWSLTFQTGP